MEKKTASQKTGLRADAQRNRDRILEVAKECFAARGDSVTLDDIVSQAGVGVGTLYRHFKTRDALIEAVYISEHEKLVLKAKELEETVPAIDALRQWLLSFVDMLATKRAMKESLNQLFSTKYDGTYRATFARPCNCCRRSAYSDRATGSAQGSRRNRLC
jgi:AcrR family transcriptional regulator